MNQLKGHMHLSGPILSLCWIFFLLLIDMTFRCVTSTVVFGAATSSFLLYVSIFPRTFFFNETMYISICQDINICHMLRFKLIAFWESRCFSNIILCLSNCYCWQFLWVQVKKLNKLCFCERLRGISFENGEVQRVDWKCGQK